jgi:hypothetical protein
MKQLKLKLIQFLAIVAIALAWAPTQALETFEQAGAITALGYDKFTVNKQVFRVTASSKLDSASADRRKFSDFKKGDMVFVKGKVLNGVNYVDILVYMTPPPS